MEIKKQHFYSEKKVKEALFRGAVFHSSQVTKGAKDTVDN